MSYAIIETGGKQVRVEPGRFYDIELLPVEPDGKVSIDKVLLVKHDDDIHVGQPWVEGATVEATVLRHFRGRKVIVYKMRPKKKTRKKRGHRQEITRLMIDAIALNGAVLAGSADVQATPEPTVEPEPATVVESEPEVEETPEPLVETVVEDSAEEPVEAIAESDAESE